jgi:hypothetical protein
MGEFSFKHRGIEVGLGVYSVISLLCLNLSLASLPVPLSIKEVLALPVLLHLIIGPVGMIYTLVTEFRLWKQETNEYSKNGLIIPILSCLITMFTLGYYVFLTTRAV